MSAPRRIFSCRGAAIVLALGCAISLTALSVAMVRALADPPTETTAAPPVTTTGPEVTTTADSSTPPTTTTDMTSSTITSTTATSVTSSSGSTTTATTSVQGTTSVAITMMTTSEVLSSIPSAAAQVTPAAKPQQLTAPSQNIQAFKTAIPVQQNPQPASQSDLVRLSNAVTTPVNQNAQNPGVWDGVVRQWNPDWVRYDEYFRPVIFNPFRDPLQIVYLVAGVAQVLVIQPLAVIVTEIAEIGAHSFTVILQNGVGALTNVAVGSLFGGGVFSGPGMPPLPPPPPPVCDKEVPVVVKYSNATYKPFVVNCIIDVGDDPSVGERKVLIDRATPAWGAWTETPAGKQFEVHKTQQVPGLNAPAEGPLPGGYPLQLVSKSEPTSALGWLIVLIAGGVALLVLTNFRRRWRRRHEDPSPRVQARSRPGGTSVVTVRETPTHGEATHAIRLEAHSGLGSQTIREVNDDHSRP
jgi:hypothetical protein